MGTETDWVTLERGVRHRCVLSPLLFSFYTEELAARVRKSRLGININWKKLSILLYTDDIILIAENEGMIQEMLNIVSDYAIKLRLNIKLLCY